MNNKPLEGIKVVELSTMIAAPCCGRALADFGAEVVKIENIEGDVLRYFIEGSSTDQEENPLFDIENTNKKSLALNLKTDEGINIMQKLLKEADVFLTNIREKSLFRLGLSYEQVSINFPKLIYAHVSGYGEKGSEAGRPGYDGIAFFARSGMLRDSAQEPEGLLTLPMGGLGDHITGMMLVGGICAALLKQIKTGKGDKVVTSLYHAGIWGVGAQLYYSQFFKGTEKINYERISAREFFYKCKDEDWILIFLESYKEYKNMCNVIGREDLLGDGNFESLPVTNDELLEIIKEIIKTKNFSEWSEIFRKAGVPFEKANYVSDVLKDEQAIVNNYIQENSYPSGKRMYLPTIPIKFKGSESLEYGKSPILGENSDEILKGLGYSADGIKQLVEKDIVVLNKRKK